MHYTFQEQAQLYPITVILKLSNCVLHFFFYTMAAYNHMFWTYEILWMRKQCTLKRQ